MGTVGHTHRRHHAHLKHRLERSARDRSGEAHTNETNSPFEPAAEHEHPSSDTLLARQDNTSTVTDDTSEPITAPSDTPTSETSEPPTTTSAVDERQASGATEPSQNPGGEGTDTPNAGQSPSPTPSQEPEPEPQPSPTPTPTENVVTSPSSVDEVQVTSMVSENTPEPSPQPTTSDNWATASPTESPMPTEWAPNESASTALPSSWSEDAQTWSESPAAAAFTESTEAISSTVTETGVIVAGTTSSSALSSALASASALSSAFVSVSSSASASAPGSTVGASVALSSSAASTTLPKEASMPPSPAASSSGSEHAAAGHETLTPGAKAGIAVGVLAAAGALLLALLFCLRRRRNRGIVGTSRSNPYAFSSYGAAEEKRSDLKRKGTMHSALDFSDGPLPSQRSRWRHLSSLGRPFARTSLSGPGMAGVGSSPARLDSANPSFDHTRAYPYARSESDDEHEHANAQPLQLDDDGSHFRNTHYEEWLAYDGAIASPSSDSPSPNKTFANTSPNNINTSPSPPMRAAALSPTLRAPQARRVPVPRLDDPFASPESPTSPPPDSHPFKTSQPLDSPSARSTLGDVYNAYAGPQPVLQRLPFLRVTPPPTQAKGYAQPMSATVGTVGTAS